MPSIIEQFRLDGKVSMVSGASRGLGQGMAIGLAEAGAEIVALSTDANNLTETTAAITALGRKVLPMTCDVSDFSQIRNAIRKTVDEFGTIDILVNNAGTIRRAPAHQYSDEDWHAVLADIRMLIAAAPSQDEFLDVLTGIESNPWSSLTAFHMDEYLDLPPEAPELLGSYLREHLFDKVAFRRVYFIDPIPADASTGGASYGQLLEQVPIEIACLGIGENGHLAFNDPPVADFEDSETVKIVELDERCRQQQVNDSCFETIVKVPKQAITLTVPALMAAASLFVIVPGPTKTEVVFRTLQGPIETACPASVLRRHKNARLFLDIDSAAKIM